MHHRRLALAILILVSVSASISTVGCATDSLRADEAARPDAGSGRRCHGANDCAAGEACNELGACVPLRPRSDGGEPLPPEVEVRVEPPGSGKKFVYVAVPEQDMVARIDSVTLQVRAIMVGRDPGALRTLKDQDVALVLNRGSASASLLRLRADGGDEVLTLKTGAGMNQLAVAPDGRHAVAFADITLSEGKIPGPQALQEVTLLRLEPGKEQAIDLPVGFRPSAVQFDAESRRAFVITETAISVLELTQISKSALPPSVSMLKDPIAEPRPSEVVVTPDGSLALLRRPGLPGIRVVDLASRVITDLDLGSEPTDLDLLPDGAMALAVLRETNQLALIELPGDLADPTTIDRLSTGGHLAGQVELAPDGGRAFLFSNATAEEVLLVADLATRAVKVHPLKKGVRAVRPSPDSQSALVIHNKVPGTPQPQDGVEGLIDRSSGYSLVDLASAFVKLQLTEADPGPSVFAPDSSAAYLLLSEPKQGVQRVEAIDLTSLLVRPIGLGSPPVALGVVPATSRVYVAQSHPLGRVTFIQQGSLASKTVTGFELNSYVIE